MSMGFMVSASTKRLPVIQRPQTTWHQCPSVVVLSAPARERHSWHRYERRMPETNASKIWVNSTPPLDST